MPAPDQGLPPDVVCGLYSKFQIFWLRFNSSLAISA
jgi:hypothetical protein